MTRRRLPAPGDHVTAVELDGEVVLHDARDGRLHRLDRLASIVWLCLDGESELDDLVADLAEGFGADPAVVRADVEHLLDDLRAAGLFAGATPSSAASPSPSDTDPVVLTDPPSP